MLPPGGMLLRGRVVEVSFSLADTSTGKEYVLSLSSNDLFSDRIVKKKWNHSVLIYYYLPFSLSEVNIVLIMTAFHSTY